MWEDVQLHIPFRDTAGSCRLDPVFSLLGTSCTAAGSMEMALQMVCVTQIWGVRKEMKGSGATCRGWMSNSGTEEIVVGLWKMPGDEPRA